VSTVCPGEYANICHTQAMSITYNTASSSSLSWQLPCHCQQPDL
jgi:hypothetical protein